MRSRKRFGLAMRDDAQRRAFVGPDLVVRLGGFLRAGAQDDPVEDRLPGELRDFDDPRVAQELGEVAADRARFGRVGRAEVDQEHADLRLGDAG